MQNLRTVNLPQPLLQCFVKVLSELLASWEPHNLTHKCQVFPAVGSKYIHHMIEIHSLPKADIHSWGQGLQARHLTWWEFKRKPQNILIQHCGGGGGAHAEACRCHWRHCDQPWPWDSSLFFWGFYSFILNRGHLLYKRFLRNYWEIVNYSSVTLNYRGIISFFWVFFKYETEFGFQTILYLKEQEV